MQKVLIVFVAVASVLIVAVFMYINRPQPCDGIFEQSAPQLDVNLRLLKANGEMAIGKEKIQDIDKEAQKVGIHLKMCCISREKNLIKPEQYQSCMDGAKEYAAKIIQITNIIGEARAAEQQGNTLLADQKTVEAKTAADDSSNIVRKLDKLTESVKKISQESNAKLDFFDDFKGTTLADHWEVIRPNTDNYTIEKDGLLILNSTVGSLDQDNIPNLFRLKTAMPEGDWTATVKFSSAFPVGNEGLGLALFEDKDQWTAATLSVSSGICNQSLAISLQRRTTEVVSSSGYLFRECVNDAWNNVVSSNNLSQPIYLRLQRAGHDFIASSRFESSGPDGWVTLNKIVSLQHVSGNLVFGFSQPYGGGSQTQVKIEWVKIETP